VQASLLIGLRLELLLALRFGGCGLHLSRRLAFLLRQPALRLSGMGLGCPAGGLRCLPGRLLFVFGGLLGATQDIAYAL